MTENGCGSVFETSGDYYVYIDEEPRWDIGISNLEFSLNDYGSITLRGHYPVAANIIAALGNKTVDVRRALTGSKDKPELIARINIKGGAWHRTVDEPVPLQPEDIVPIVVYFTFRCEVIYCKWFGFTDSIEIGEEER